MKNGAGVGGVRPTPKEQHNVKRHHTETEDSLFRCTVIVS